MIQKHTSFQSSLLLLLAAAIWGFAFVAQSVGMDYVGPFTFNCARSILGFLVLIPVILFQRRRGKFSIEPSDTAKSNTPAIWMGGILCGIFLSLATITQQAAIQYTNVGKAAFITTMYIVLVPLLRLLSGKKGSLFLWISVALGVLGLYLLCMTGSFSLAWGDILLLISALCFALQIMAVDHFVAYIPGTLLSCIQFLVCFVISGILMLIFEKPIFSQILAAWLPILYTGVLSSGVAYTLQIIGQKNLDPTVASLIMSLESCISALAGWLLLHQHLSNRELLGCAVMFCAIILAQLPSPRAAS